MSKKHALAGVRFMPNRQKPIVWVGNINLNLPKQTSTMILNHNTTASAKLRKSNHNTPVSEDTLTGVYLLPPVI